MSELEKVHGKETDKEARNAAIDRATSELFEKCPVFLSGFESFPIPDYGWIDPVVEACLKMEALNEANWKHGCRVVLAQAKEKFGTLRLYYDVVEFQPSRAKAFLAKAVGKIACALGPFGGFLNYLAIDLAYPDQTEERLKAREFLDQRASEIADEAEKKCAERCQWCGASGSGDKQLVWTRGWVSRLCEECAELSGRPRCSETKLASEQKES